MSGGVVILGAGGQVGVALGAAPWPEGLRVHRLDRAMLDLSRPAAAGAALARLAPAVVVNAAAYTAVDRAEGEREQAFAINRDGPAALAAACERLGAALVHLSTDYVFDGTKPGAYVETDPVGPLGVYGASKAAGEAAIRASLDRHVILRTAWVFGEHRENFVKRMLQLGAERREVAVVADQRGCPTPARAIAGAIVAIVERLSRAGDGGVPFGTYHFAGGEPISRHGFAEAIFAEAERHGLRRPRVRAIATADHPTPARRPANAALSSEALRGALGIEPADWRGELAALIPRLRSAAGRPRG